jgi:putative endonuclease
MLRCADGTFYTGITTDLARRLSEHNGARPGGARYTRSRRPVVLHYKESVTDRSAAARREAALRRLTRAAKQALGVGRRSSGRKQRRAT